MIFQMNGFSILETPPYTEGLCVCANFKLDLNRDVVNQKTILLSISIKNINYRTFNFYYSKQNDKITDCIQLISVILQGTEGMHIGLFPGARFDYKLTHFLSLTGLLNSLSKMLKYCLLQQVYHYSTRYNIV